MQYYKELAENIQDLLNAVVIRAAEDFREYSVKLLQNPEDEEAAREKEEVIAFFLSQDFKVYTTVSGKMILTRLEAEEVQMAELFVEFREKKEAMMDCRKRFRAGKNSDQALMAEAIRLAQRIREIERIPEGVWKDLFELKTREKNALGEISQWRRKYAKEEKYAECAACSALSGAVSES